MKVKQNILFIISIIYIVITGILNIIGYFKLPDNMNTQFSLSGETVNSMPKSIYLPATVAIVILLSVLCFKNEKQQKIKYFVINTIIVIANIAMIALQL